MLLLGFYEAIFSKERDFATVAVSPVGHLPLFSELTVGIWFISYKVPPSSLPCKDFHRAWQWLPPLHSILHSIPLNR